MNDKTPSTHYNLFAKALIAWYEKEARPLAWRKTTDPYIIWISEVMLQQTQVNTVAPYFERFIQRYPDLYHLAKASIDDVLSNWSGLGYYQRARNLHRTATKIVHELQGQFPNDYDTLIQLPGIGRYTAGAILSIAFNQPYPVLDGNVKRVLSRYVGIRESLRLRHTEQRLWKIATESIPPKEAGVFNSAMMELGALICRPNANEIRCHQCPVKTRCFSYKSNATREIPYLPKSSKKTYQEMHLFWARHRDEVLMLQANQSDIVQSMWELPNQIVQQHDQPYFKAAAIQSNRIVSLEELVDNTPNDDVLHTRVTWTYLARTTHSITHRTIHCLLYTAPLTSPHRHLLNKLIALKPTYRFVPIERMLDLPHSSLMKKVLNLYYQKARTSKS